MEPIYIKTDKNGTKIYHDYTCPRCGGHAYIEHFSHVDGGVCFKCNGAGRLDKPMIIRRYTPEYQAKLDAKRDAKQIAYYTENKDKINAKVLRQLGFIDTDTLYLYTGKTYGIKEELKAGGAHFEKFGDAPVWIAKKDLGDFEGTYKLAVTTNDIPKVIGDYGVGQYQNVFNIQCLDVISDWLNDTYWKDYHERLEKQPKSPKRYWRH